MENSRKESIEYCKNLIRIVANDKLLQLHFLPPAERERALAYYGLEAELMHIHSHVSEEMIGHIRYAWWREAMDQLGSPHQQHPVLQLLAGSDIEKDVLITLVDDYREAYPAFPAHPRAYPTQQARFLRAGKIIENHRQRHGSYRKWWLLLKLMR